MSKELAPLEWLDYYKQIIIESNKTFRPNGFDLIEKELKALEIIKEKRVDMDFLFEEWEEKNYEFALENYNFNHDIELTQEEYDLLKEVLKND